VCPADCSLPCAYLSFFLLGVSSSCLQLVPGHLAGCVVRLWAVFLVFHDTSPVAHSMPEALGGCGNYWMADGEGSVNCKIFLCFCFVLFF